MKQNRRVVDIKGEPTRIAAFMEAATDGLTVSMRTAGTQEAVDLREALLNADREREGVARVTINGDTAGVLAEKLERAAKTWRLDAEDGERYFTALVTRDTTESAVIPVAATTAEEAAELAVSREAEQEYDHLFQPNEGNVGESAYLGAGLEDVEEISREQYDVLAATGTERAGKTLWFQAYNELAVVFGDKPRFASYQLDSERLRRIVQLEQLRQTYGLTEVRVADGPDWEDEDNLRLSFHELVVSAGQFRFVSEPKHGDGDLETKPMDIDELVRVAAQEGDYYCADEPEDLKEMIAQSAETHTARPTGPSP